MRRISKNKPRNGPPWRACPTTKIDLTNAPEVRGWRTAVVGKFYRPIKTPVTIRVDADVLAWLKHQSRAYQTRINKLLREAIGRKVPTPRSSSK